MAYGMRDRVREQVSGFAGGTGALTLPGAAVGAGLTFLQGWGASGTGEYAIVLGSQWETGFGTLNAGGTTLTRTTVYDGSSGVGVAVTFSSGTADVFGVIPAELSHHLNMREISVTSAATTDVGAVRGARVAISGTTGPITSFGTSANRLRFVRHSGSTITYNATSMILLGGVSRVTAAGDIGIYASDASGNWRELSYQRASGFGANLAVLASGLALIGGTLTASAGSSALTIAIKTNAGNDPSATEPVYVVFRNATGATGDYTLMAITAATSLVISSGSTLGVTSSTAFRLWVVGFNDAGTFRLGVKNCSTSTQIFPLDQTQVASSTAEGGAGAADSAGVFYTGTAVTSKPFAILGFLEWSSSGLTAGTWTTSNLATIQLFGPGVKKPGEMIQIKYLTSSTQEQTTSTTYTASANLTTTITPTSAANLIRAKCLANGGVGNNDNSFIGSLFRGSTQIGSTGTAYTAGGQATSGFICYALDFPNSASSTTYALKFKSGSGQTITLLNTGFGGTGILEVEEVMG